MESVSSKRIMHCGRVRVEVWFNLLMSFASVLNVRRTAGPPVNDLAREAWLLDRAAGGEVSLLLASWEGPVVVLGYSQQPEAADLDWCRANGIPVLRRLTGGTGVIHRGDLGVGLFLPEEHSWAKGVIGLYGRFLDVLGPSLHSLGSEVSRLDEAGHASRVRSPVCFLDQLSDTLVVDGRKVVGCAQTRRRGAVLIHAAVLLGLDATLYERVFGVPADEIRAGLAPALPGGDTEEIGEAIAGALAKALGLELEWCQPESVPAQYLEPYKSARWSPVLPEGG
jgi:lipoate-protein ligase A